MKPRGQRQDVAFLALAVAVLAIAVALFVGVRALPGLRARRAPAPPPPPVAKPAPLPAQPPGSRSHDPFKGKPAPVTPGAAAKPSPELELKLVGIVRGREPLAVIRRGNRRYYVKRGDQVSGYLLTEIGESRAVLAKGTEQVTLKLPAPSLEEGTVTRSSSR